MVGYLMLLKMLHSNHNLHKKRMSDNATLNQTNNKSLKSDARRRIKKERYDPEEPGMCRVCLKEGNIPIYGNETYEDVSEALCTFGDITVSSNDNYTKFLCLVCHEFLQKAIEFRKKAKQSDETIRWQQVESYLDNENETADNIHDDVSSGNEETGKVEHNYFCRKCVRGFKTFKEYSEHRLSAEHENVRHKCPICNKLYTALYIKKHMLLHKMERQYMCDICGKKFPLQAPFNRHRLTHFYSLPFQCTLCPYKGRFRESLKMHMRSHTGEKPYQCSQCPSRFVNASNLNKHMLTHTRNHDFKCDMCGRGFYTKRDLGSHFKVDHSGIKEHTCNMCGKAFGYRKQMMKHQLVVHKREKLRSGRLPLYLQVESQSNAVGD